MYMTEDGVPVVYVEGLGWVNAQEGSDGQLYCVYDEAAPEAMGQADMGSGGVIVGEGERDGTVGQEKAGLTHEAERGHAPTEEEQGVEPVAAQNAPETKLTTANDAVSQTEKRLSIKCFSASCVPSSSLSHAIASHGHSCRRRRRRSGWSRRRQLSWPAWRR